MTMTRAASRSVLTALAQRVGRGRDLVVLDGPDAGADALRELALRLPPHLHPVVVAGAPEMTPDGLALRILDGLGMRASAEPRGAVAQHAEQLRARGHALVLLVEAPAGLGEDVLRWLAKLLEPRQALVRIVLAAPHYTVFLDALAASGTCVDLVRLDPHAPGRSARSGAAAARTIEPPREPPLPFVIAPAAPPAPAEAVRAEPQAALPAPEAFAARPARDRHALWSIDELMGDAEYPEPAAQAAARSAAPAVAPRVAAPDRAGPRPDVSAPRSDGARPGIAAPPAVPDRARRRTAARLAAGVTAILALAIGAWLVMRLLSTTPARVAERAPAVSVAVPAQTPRVDAVRLPGAPGAPVRAPAAIAGADVSDLDQAIAVLSRSADPVAYEAAEAFLREHGPDDAGYAALDALDAARASNPGAAAELLMARSRVRAALCAAWADDPPGEAARRLGCPGARPDTDARH